MSSSESMKRSADTDGSGQILLESQKTGDERKINKTNESQGICYWLVRRVQTPCTNYTFHYIKRGLFILTCLSF